MTVWVTAGVVFLAVALAMLAISLTWEWLRERQRRRDAVNQLRKLTTETVLKTSSGAGSLFRDPEAEQASWMPALSARLSHLVDVQNLLQQADLSWTPQTYLFRGAGFSVGLGIAAFLVTGRMMVAVPAAVLGGLLPYFYIRRRIQKRLAAFEEHLPDAIDLMGRAIRAGHPLSSGLKMVADEAAEPISGEFRRIFEEQRFGMPFDDTMLGLADRVPMVDTRILVTAILIQREVGGNLAEVLDKISQVVRERFQIRRQLRTFTAQGRMSGYVLGGLPIAIGVAVFVLNPDYIMTLFREPIGHWMLGAAAVLQVTGYMWIRKITNIEI
jgi:tight adherence protein B